MPPDLLPNGIVRIDGLSNREFLERYARPGCIGLSGGISLIDRAICRAQRHLDAEENWGMWSHAFLFQGRRADGHHWVIESDLQVHRKHIQLGVQENRISKYFDEELYTMLAVLDFDLKENQVALLVSEALELVANRARYSLRELLGTLIALRRSSQEQIEGIQGSVEKMEKRRKGRSNNQDPRSREDPIANFKESKTGHHSAEKADSQSALPQNGSWIFSGSWIFYLTASPAASGAASASAVARSAASKVA